MPKIFVDKDEREYIEQYDFHSKYERRPFDLVPVLKELCFSQFAKMYEPWWGKSVEKEEDSSSQPNIVIETNLTSGISYNENHETNSQCSLEFELSDEEYAADDDDKFFSFNGMQL